MLHSLVVGDYHHEVNRLAAQLQAPATSGNADWSRTTPPLGCLAGHYTLAVLTAETDRNFDNGWHHGYALCMVHYLVRNRFVRSSHDFIEDVRGFHDTLANIGLILVILVVGGPTHAGRDQDDAAERQETFRYRATSQSHSKPLLCPCGQPRIFFLLDSICV